MLDRPEDEEEEEDENPFERITWPLLPPALPKDGDHYQPPLYKPKNLPQRFSLISIYIINIGVENKWSEPPLKNKPHNFLEHIFIASQLHCGSAMASPCLFQKCKSQPSPWAHRFSAKNPGALNVMPGICKPLGLTISFQKCNCDPLGLTISFQK